MLTACSGLCQLSAQHVSNHILTYMITRTHVTSVLMPTIQRCFDSKTGVPQVYILLASPATLLRQLGVCRIERKLDETTTSAAVVAASGQEVGAPHEWKPPATGGPPKSTCGLWNSWQPLGYTAGRTLQVHFQRTQPVHRPKYHA